MNVLDELLQHTENRALYYSSAHNDEESIIPIPSEPALWLVLTKICGKSDVLWILEPTL